MKRVDSILDQMHIVVDELLENLQRVYSLSKEKGINGEVLSIQKEQEEKFEKLVALDEELKKEVSFLEEATSSDLGKKVREKIRLVQKLNESFLTSLKIRQGIIKEELDKKRQGKRKLGKIEKAYVKRKRSKIDASC